jgi:hypothetical protein
MNRKGGKYANEIESNEGEEEIKRFQRFHREMFVDTGE